MGLRRDRDYCYVEAKPCIDWVQRYFNDCLCNLRDEVSFGFGIASVTFWGFAEVPQIVTNFRAKSTEGVSLLLLLTWILGDVFNLAGCLLEPSTLPTQFYTALLYTVGSLILTCQCLYYDHFLPWLRNQGKKDHQVVADEKDLLDKPLLTPELADSGKELVAHDERKNNMLSNMASISNQSRVVNGVARYGAFVAAIAANLPNQTRALNRAILQNNLRVDNVSDAYGQMLGWGMAFIYIAGRIPQIWLNMKRGTVEGLNPCMFVFALVANITYVLSILVRSCKWVDLKANMAWLLDSSICLSLDFLILLQFIYYGFRKREQNRNNARPEARDTLA